MKKIFIFCIVFLFTSFLVADEKKGFLTSKWCAQNGMFSDCRLESFVCGGEDCFKDWNFQDGIKEELVLFVHNEGKYYDVKLDGIQRYKLDSAINRNEVSLIGRIDGDKIYANDFKAPPPPKKSFFKGCL
ncbi:MAG: hypothetical protein PWQ42_480 [Sulfurospirillum sp.]|jgi:hypothetical protein|nr:hypothetical protein [Sulfurospirillum sp.]DAB32431.1 MAG TPA: hypothetical protein CFH79_03895 [Sulfurospirillum sp. UBA11407]DAB33431.1 MAG TPA: hypothetical protein CFH82_10485 [Sulfurospirillum sp. UBA12182]